MSFQPPSPTSTSPPLPGHLDSSSLVLDFGHQSRDEIAALLDGMGFDDKEEPLPSTLTGQQGLSPCAQEFSPARVFNAPPLPITSPTGVTPVRGNSPTLDPSQVPIGSKLAKNRTLLGHAKPSVFNILNTFQRRWFILVDHLRTAVLSAQKAKDGKIFWVEFAPQYHAHLVKCAVALVPHPIHKVKRVMFAYILELLNGEGPQTFFDLTKGTRIATQAQKEKW
jgi:hypothetical protein